MQAVIPFFLYHCSLWVSAILDHFGYPPPHLDQWQQRIWYNLGAAQELLHQMCTHLAQGLPTVASPQRAEPSLLLHKPASGLTRPSQGGKFIKASKGGGPTPSTTTTGLPRLQRLHLLKRRLKRRSVRLPNTLLPVRP